LILRGQHDKARDVLKQIYQYASPETLELKLHVVKEHVAATTVMQRSATFWQRSTKLWTHKPQGVQQPNNHNLRPWIDWLLM
jgi:SP family myo-inositol transporter-like MFS transporter 13